MQGVSRHGVFADWIGVTSAPFQPAFDDVLDYIMASTLCKAYEDESKFVLKARGNYNSVATVTRFRTKRFDKLTIPGKMLELLRERDQLHDVLGILSVVAHNTTRIDLAQDQVFSDPARYAAELHRVRRLGHAGKIRLGRKSVPPAKVEPRIKPRWDGVMSGSVMIGSHGDRYSAIVYDKTAERVAKQGAIISENLFRVEVRTTEGSLRDVLDPDPLFFLLASPDLVACPSGVPVWEKNTLMAAPDFPPVVPLEPAQIALGIVDNSVAIERLVEVLGQTNPATVALVRRRLNARLDSALRADTALAKKTA